MPRKPSQSDEALLDEILALLIQGGAEALTLRAAAERVALSPSTLIQRFGSRAEMIDRALRRSTQTIKAKLPSQPSESALIDWLVESAQAFQTRDQLIGQLALLAEDIRDTKSQRAAMARRHMEVIRKGIRMQLEGLACVDSQAGAMLIEAQWHGLIIQWGISGKGGLDTWMKSGLRKTIRFVLQKNLPLTNSC